MYCWGKSYLPSLSESKLIENDLKFYIIFVSPTCSRPNRLQRYEMFSQILNNCTIIFHESTTFSLGDVGCGIFSSLSSLLILILPLKVTLMRKNDLMPIDGTCGEEINASLKPECSVFKMDIVQQCSHIVHLYKGIDSKRRGEKVRDTFPCSMYGTSWP